MKKTYVAIAGRKPVLSETGEVLAGAVEWFEWVGDDSFDALCAANVALQVGRCDYVYAKEIGGEEFHRAARPESLPPANDFVGRFACPPGQKIWWNGGAKKSS